MGTTRSAWLAVIAGLALGFNGASGAPLGTAFTFQGELKNTGVIAAGPVDLRFRLFDALAGGTQIGSQLARSSIGLLDGRFTVGDLDFGVGSFGGDERYLEVDVAVAGSGLFTTLSPRFKITAAPQAMHALNATSAALATSAATLNGQPASFYTNAGNMSAGVLPSGRLAGTYTGALNLANPSNILQGSGATITALNATNVASGTLADARLSANVALRGSANSFTAFNAFGGPVTDATVLDATGHVQIGPSGSLNLGFGSNDIQARIGGTATALHLNAFGGGVAIGGSGSGSLSVGTTSAEARLHVLDGSAGVVTASASSSAVFERNGNNYLAILGPDASEKGISFGSPLNSVHGGIYYTNTGTMNFRTDGNAAKVVIDQNGLVGIGTTTPEGMIDARVPSGVCVANFQSLQNGGDAQLQLVETVSGSRLGAVIQYDGGSNALNLGTVDTAGGARIDALRILRGSPNVSVLGDLSVAGSFSAPSMGSPLLVNHATGDPQILLQTGGSTLWTIRNLATGSGGDTLQFRNTAGVTKLELVQGATSTVNGNLSILGTLTATTKSFKIDHPLDPEHKYLVHTCVESDEMVNVYSGNATTDDRGYVTITLPAWFEALNGDVRYQLTVIDDADSEQFVWAKVAQRVKDNRFTIRTSSPHVAVSWQVTGVRHDAFANHERTPVEINKEPENVGRYIAPEAYGKPASARLLTPGDAAGTHLPKEAPSPVPNTPTTIVD